MTAQHLMKKIIGSIQQTFFGKTEAVELAVCSFLSGGHLLIEDIPGVGKTTLAKAMASAFGGKFSRIQFTSDLLPSDILGVSIWNSEKRQFDFKQGPLFSNIVLADEINRASPKTQSALLEAMSELQISQEGVSHSLETPFMVIATQNVNESFGTYPLPDSQLDRFTMRLKLGYATTAVEKEIITSSTVATKLHRTDTDTAAISAQELQNLRKEIEETKVDDAVLDYLLAIVEKTRQTDQLHTGASPRGGIALYHCAKAFARLKGRNFVLTEDIQHLAVPVLAHRLIQKNDGGYSHLQLHSAETLLLKIIHSMEVPI